MFDDSPSLDTLRRLRPLARFTDAQLMTIRRCLEVRQADDNHELLEYGSTRDHLLFVLQGGVILNGHNGDGHSLSFTAADSLNPVAAVRPSQYSVIASGPIHFLEIEKQLLMDFAAVCDRDDWSQFEFRDIDREKELNPLVVKLFQDVMADRVSLPSLPDVAMRIQRAMNQPNLSSGSLAEILMTDPAISAKIIKVANSPIYRGVTAIDTLPAAITRLGMDATYKQVMMYAVNDLFNSQSEWAKTYMKQVMAHSRRVAAISRILAQKTRLFSPDQAMLAGLIHDLGVVVIVQYLQQYSDISDLHKVDVVVSLMRAQITSLLLRNWNFSNEIVTVSEHCEDWFRNEHQEADLCDLVMVAQYHSYMGTNQLANIPPVALMPAMHKLHMDYDESVQLLQESVSEIREIERILH